MTGAVLLFLVENLLVTLNGVPLGELGPPYEVLPGQAVAEAVGAGLNRCATNMTAEELEECLGVKVNFNPEGGQLILDSRGLWDSEKEKGQ